MSTLIGFRGRKLSIYQFVAWISYILAAVLKLCKASGNLLGNRQLTARTSRYPQETFSVLSDKQWSLTVVKVWSCSCHRAWPLAKRRGKGFERTYATSVKIDSIQVVFKRRRKRRKKKAVCGGTCLLFQRWGGPGRGIPVSPSPGRAVTQENHVSETKQNKPK